MVDNEFEEPLDAPPLAEEDSGGYLPHHDYQGRALPRANMPAVGTSPGIELHEMNHRFGVSGPVSVTCVDYDAEQFESSDLTSPAALEAFLEQHRPAWSQVRWIDVRGLDNGAVVKALASKYGLHPLAVEDLTTSQRPKCEDYAAVGDNPARLFVVANTVHLYKRQYHTRQVGFFLGHNTLLTFQTGPEDLFAPVRARMATAGSVVRKTDASFLLYSLIDVLVDYLFPILDRVSHRLERIESRVLLEEYDGVMHDVYVVKQRLMLLRRAIWPMRELIHQLHRDPHECLSEETQTYFRDVYDHILYIVDLTETYRDFAAGLAESYMTAIANRTNDIMKTLTIISTIFVPLTFLAGVYGMNMTMPWLKSQWLYPTFWAVSIVCMLTMLNFFRGKGWILAGKRESETRRTDRSRKKQNESTK